MKKVFFDFDSTLVTCESVDSIAVRKQIFHNIEHLTNAAMNGEVPLEAIFTKKIDLIAPSRADIESAIDLCRRSITEGAVETIATLLQHGVTPYIVSGGFKEIIDTIAETIFDIPSSQVIANTLQFDHDGAYTCIDPSSPCTMSNGKALVLEQHKTPDTTLYMIGDGMTDAVCRDVAEFIGFGGVVVRPAVSAVSPIYITHSDLRAVLEYIIVGR